ncbi:ABC transporter ATP-binding protein [Oscillospiraceae bacterium LTW-04]|nr:ATP-binding cassette domain-containing protein [Oscillospiraceae bacterium MB24-C1]
MTLTADSLTVRFGEQIVLQDFSHCFESGITCILGPSGCGKTTLLRALMGLTPADGGRVFCDITNPKKSVMFQENRLCENMSAISNLRFVCPHRTKAEMEQALTKAGLGGSLYHPVRNLSGGMQRRVALTRALLADFDLLFLDEPFTGLDDNTRDHLLPLITQYADGKTVLLVTHDEAVAKKLGAQILRLV